MSVPAVWGYNKWEPTCVLWELDKEHKKHETTEIRSPHGEYTVWLSKSGTQNGALCGGVT